MEGASRKNERKDNSHEKFCFLYGEEKLLPRGNMCSTGRARVTFTQKHAYVPLLIRERLRTSWTREYAKMRVDKDCLKKEAFYDVYLLKFGNKGKHMCSEEVSDQIR
ncbi:hypothetical protein Y032_0079g1263 [Ancylostoma ceylanicum]|uniref:Uncharacterized protein n=1 Tax=Ancylostoma ceylanicum TaxID=53326 RepID=A0A016TTF1_9BILA|nr:hypothetical protein Y032_0079g1263 [Ancylostoma ceylanicum]